MGLVEHLDAVEPRPRAVPPGQPLQHREGKIHLSGVLVPLAHPPPGRRCRSRSVRPARCAGPEGLQTVPLGPGEGVVQAVHAAQERRAVAEDEVGHRQAHQVVPVLRHQTEVLLGDVAGAGGGSSAPVILRGAGCGQPGFVLLGGIPKGVRRNPFFQDQPVAEVDAPDFVQRCHSWYTPFSVRWPEGPALPRMHRRAIQSYGIIPFLSILPPVCGSVPQEIALAARCPCTTGRR